MKEDIENLEDHLTKYGYKKPTEKLPEIQMDSLDDSDVDASGKSSCSSGSPQNNSDKENQPKDIEITTEEDHNQESTPEPEVAEIDFLLTPVRPTTFTKFIQNPARPGPQTEDIATLSLDFKEPLPPVTTTPMMKSGKDHPKNTNIDSPDSSTELPVQPLTTTPMLKNFDESPTGEPQMSNQSLADDFPTPPVFTTPGLQRYGSRRHGEIMAEHNILLETPPPPSFTSINLLNPDDICSLPKSTTSAVESQPCSGLVKEEVTLPAINQEAFLQLPLCLQRQFSLEQVNHFIRKTANFLSTKSGDNRSLTDEELVSFLELGPMTRTFTLVMIKLNYFTIIRNGHYEVL